MKLQTYDLEAKKISEVEVKETLLRTELNPQLLKDYIVAYRRNQRQWSASTKGRSEINHSNKKPHRQKGTGRARQGTLAAPQFRGGGVVFGPKPKFDQHIRINQKEKRAVIHYLISKKIEENKLILLDNTKMKEPKTKKVVHFLEKCSLDKRTLFVGESDQKNKSTAKSSTHTHFKKSLQNLAKVEFSQVCQLNGYQILKAENVVMTEASLKQFLESK